MQVRALKYSPAAKTFHWLTAALLTIQVIIGWTMEGAHRHRPPDLLNEVHMTIGLTILVLIVARFVLRLVEGAPPTEPGTPVWQAAAARIVHYSLYVLALLFPLTGWANATLHGWPIAFLGIIPLPGFFPSISFVRSFGHIHNILVWYLIAFVMVHIAAALWHHFAMRDRTFRRMLPESLDRDAKVTAAPVR